MRQSGIAEEFALCGECLVVSPYIEWGGTSTSMVCPRCKHEHFDDDSAVVYTGTEIEMARERRDLLEYLS